LILDLVTEILDLEPENSGFHDVLVICPNTENQSHIPTGGFQIKENESSTYGPQFGLINDHLVALVGI